MAASPDRIIAIQLLRALAAAIVAVVHMAYAFADHVGPGLRLPAPHEVAGQFAVSLFFVISGYIMVVSSARLAGRKGATRLFWVRRCIRILPPYWLASMFLLAVFLWLGTRIVPAEVAWSMILVPFAESGANASAFTGRPEFFLWTGWTLFFEMVFYLLFGLALSYGRVWAIAVSTALIAILVGAGMVLRPELALAVSITRPVMLLFVCGMVLALLRERGWQVPPPVRWLAAGAALAAFSLMPAPVDFTALDFTYLAWAGLPALLLCVALIGGLVSIPFPLMVNRLGDASYALYLLHVPLAHFWINLFPLRLGAWPFLISLVIVAYASSLLFYRFVERPLTALLNRRLGGDRPNDPNLQQTYA